MTTHPSQIKNLNRHLIELGLITMRDSPNGKRYGRRDKAGRIIEAYGFDLSPLAVRQAEFRASAEKGRARFEAMRHWRRRATIAWKGIEQIAETAAELGLPAETWRQPAMEARQMARRLARIERLEELALGVATLERRQGEARERLEAALAAVRQLAASPPDSVKIGPRGPENWPYNTPTNQPFDPSDTVIAQEKSKSVSGGGKKPSAWDGLDAGNVAQTDWS